MAMRILAKCLLFAVLVSGWGGAAFAAGSASGVAGQQADIEVFVREGCQHCAS
ncbi:MAG: hypothetical protein HYZ46_01400, partial [Nitrosomonadales bacterium]|nr:hypothetical protein [Nitrosomonadales bacterium]